MKFASLVLGLVLASSISGAAEKKSGERKPAQQGSFICNDPLVEEVYSNLQVQKFLNSYCDNSKNYTVTYRYFSGAEGRFTVCCIQR